MLKLIFTLFSLDLLALRRWFSEQKIVKLVISLLFLTLLLSLSLFVYFSSREYFRLLSEFEIFGQAVAAYLLHASVLVTFWLGLGGTALAFLLTISSPSLFWSYLATLPLPPSGISVYLLLRQVGGSLLWSLLILLPAGLSALQIFSTDPVAPLRLVFLLLTIVIWSSSFGTLLALLLGRVLQLRSSRLLVPLLAGLFLIATISLLRFILPAGLFRLQEAPAETFFQQFNQLPLNQAYLPTLILTRFLFRFDLLYFLSANLTSLLLLLPAFLATSLILHRLWQLQAAKPYAAQKPKTLPRWLLSHRTSFLLGKDLLLLRRSPSDLGYAAFLLLLILGFSFFLGQSFSTRLFSRSFTLDLGLLSLGWLLFYATAYFLRLAFPLVAREGRSAWLVFTSPLSPLAITLGKIAAVLLSAFPLILVIGVSWFLLPLDGQLRINLFLISLIAILLIGLTQVLLGFLSPQFQHSTSPEKTSTSLPGLVALFVSLALIWLTLRFGRAYLLATLTLDLQIGVIAFIFLLLAVLFFLAQLALHRYRFNSQK